MDLNGLPLVLGSILHIAVPLLYATIGETLTERAGIVNLSLDGSIMLAALAGFAGAYVTGSLWAGFALAIVAGALAALIVAVAGITLRLNQIAVGFVLTMLCTDLSSFLGIPYVRQTGPYVPHMTIPWLSQIPILGPIFFDQDLLTYGALILVAVVWFYMYRTQPGLQLLGIGEHPEGAYARGTAVNRLRYLYAVLGGALVGVAGASYSLSVNLGWSQRVTAGLGWIALSIVIFGGWNPLRVALGAYLFGALSYLGIRLQYVFPTMPTEVFSVAPFPVMILALLIVNSDMVDRLLGALPPGVRYRVRAAIRTAAPGALGTTFEKG